MRLLPHKYLRLESRLSLLKQTVWLQEVNQTDVIDVLAIIRDKFVTVEVMNSLQVSLGSNLLDVEEDRVVHHVASSKEATVRIKSVQDVLSLLGVQSN